jgi:hypothetical protein
MITTALIASHKKTPVKVNLDHVKSHPGVYRIISDDRHLLTRIVSHPNLTRLLLIRTDCNISVAQLHEDDWYAEIFELAEDSVSLTFSN